LLSFPETFRFFLVFFGFLKSSRTKYNEVEF